jgi:integrase
VLYDRYRGYDLRESEIQTLTDLGKFRVINAEDLARHGYGGDRGRMERETESLVRQGLVEEKRFETSLSKSTRMYALTKAGRRLMQRSGRVPNDQEIYAGFVKPREAKHDAELYRVYQRTLRTVWRLTLRRAKVPYFRLYDLRSTYATRLSAGGVADEWVTQLLRQSDSKVFKKYSQMKLRMQREALEKMNRQANEMTSEVTTAVQKSKSLCTVPAQF